MNEQPSNDPARVALITGAAGGIGSRMARRFDTDGWRLALLERPRNLDAVRSAFPGALALGVDLASAEDTTSAVAGVLDSHGRIDALLNIVGGFGMQSALELDDAALDRQLAINLRTAVHATRAVLPGMLERGSGYVLGMGAATVVRGSARMPAYGAAKSALAGYLRSVRAEVEPQGVGVGLLVPMGTVDTPANREAMPSADPSSWIDPDELAAAAAFLVGRGARGRVHELRVYGPA
jgi:NAD(P)-dependent dehydrogenase (short-subunit alcohol dehydrogenase family)